MASTSNSSQAWSQPSSWRKYHIANRSPSPHNPQATSSRPTFRCPTIKDHQDFIDSRFSSNRSFSFELQSKFSFISNEAASIWSQFGSDRRLVPNHRKMTCGGTTLITDLIGLFGGLRVVDTACPLTAVVRIECWLLLFIDGEWLRLLALNIDFRWW